MKKHGFLLISWKNAIFKFKAFKRGKMGKIEFLDDELRKSRIFFFKKTTNFIKNFVHLEKKHGF